MILFPVLSLILASGAPSEPVVGSLRFERARHSAAVYALARDPSTDDWLSAGVDKTVRRWRGGLPAGPPLRFATGEGRDGGFYSLAVSSLGLVAVGEGNSKGAGVWVYDPTKGAAAPVSRVAVASNLVCSLSFSPDGKLLAVGDQDGGLRVLRVADRTSVFDRVAEKGQRVSAVAFAPDGRRLAYAAGGTAGVVEATPEANEVARLSLKSPILCLAWRGGSSLALGQKSGEASVWKVGDPEARGLLTGLTDSRSGVLAAATDEGGKVLALGSNEGQVLLYERGDRSPRRIRLAKDKSEVWAVGLTPDGKRLVAGLGNGKVCEIDVARKEETKVFSPSLPRVNGIQWSAKGDALCWKADGQPTAFNLELSQPLFKGDVSEDDGHRQGGARVVPEEDYKASIQGDDRWARLREKEPILYDAIFLDERRLLVATDKGLKLYDGPDSEPRRLPIDGIVSSLARSPDHKRIAAGFTNGSIRVYPADIENAAALAALYVVDGEWVAWQERTGLYDSSVGGDSIFGYQVNRGEESLASFVPARLKEAEYRRPHLLTALLSDGELSAVAAPLEKAIVDVPKVELLTVDNGKFLDGMWQVDGEDAEVRFSVEGGKPSQRIAVRTNHAGVPREIPGLLSLGGKDKTYLVNGLVPGPNVVRTYLDGMPFGEPFTIYRRAQASEDHGRLVVLAIGIGEYKTANLRLGQPVRDARAFVETVQRFSISDKATVTKTLFDAEATKQGFLAGLDWLKAEATAGDRVMVFIASHGSRQEKGVYVTPYDFLPERPEETGLPWSELAQRLSEVSCRSLVVFSDNCHSGAAPIIFRNLELFRQAQDAARQEQRRLATDVAVFAACGTDQESAEFPSIGHGLFTKALLEGLRHEIAGQGYDPLTGIVTVAGLQDAIQRGMDMIYLNQVKEERGPTNPQKATFMVPDGTIPLSRVRPAAPTAPGGRR